AEAPTPTTGKALRWSARFEFESISAGASSETPGTPSAGERFRAGARPCGRFEPCLGISPPWASKHIPPATQGGGPPGLASRPLALLARDLQPRLGLRTKNRPTTTRTSFETCSRRWASIRRRRHREG